MDARDPSLPVYERPTVADYGTLAELTAETGMVLLGAEGISGALVPPPVDTPGPDTPGGPGVPAGPSGEILGATQVTEALPEGGALGDAAPGAPGESAPAGTEAEDGGGGGGGTVNTGSGGAGESLPFTGFAAAGAAAVGTVLAGTGAALRRALRRKRL
jgi:hypothetical protein